MKTKKEKRITIRLDEEEYNKLYELANQLDLESKSMVLRMLLNAAYEKLRTL